MERFWGGPAAEEDMFLLYGVSSSSFGATCKSQVIPEGLFYMQPLILISRHRSRHVVACRFQDLRLTLELTLHTRRDSSQGTDRYAEVLDPKLQTPKPDLCCRAHSGTVSGG